MGTKTNPDADPFDFAPGWQPNPGDTIIGKVDGLDVAESQYGRYPVVTVVDDSGERVALHAFHTVLRSAFKRTRPNIGDRIAVRYIGEVTESKDGKKLSQSYHGYQVRKLDQDAASFWGTEPATADDWVSDEPPF